MCQPDRQAWPNPSDVGTSCWVVANNAWSTKLMPARLRSLTSWPAARCGGSLDRKDVKRSTRGAAALSWLVTLGQCRTACHRATLAPSANGHPAREPRLTLRVAAEDGSGRRTLEPGGSISSRGIGGPQL